MTIDEAKYYDESYPLSVLRTTPALTSLTPNTGVVAVPHLVTIHGSKFNSQTKVYVDGVLAVAAFIDDHTMTTTLQAAIPGTDNVQARNDDRNSATLPFVFTATQEETPESAQEPEAEPDFGTPIPVEELPVE